MICTFKPRGPFQLPPILAALLVLQQLSFVGDPLTTVVTHCDHFSRAVKKLVLILAASDILLHITQDCSVCIACKLRRWKQECR